MGSERELPEGIRVARRVLVTGNAGAGKSTLASKLGKALGLDVIALDTVVWGPRWRATPRHEVRRRIQEIALAPSWLVDGVSSHLAHAADLVVFLDMPRPVCYWRCLRRNLPYLFRSRPGLPGECPELLIAPKLVRIIWKFPTTVRSSLLLDVAHGQIHGDFVHLRNHSEVESYLRSVGSTFEDC